MPQSLSCLFVHAIFSTHNRIRFLDDLAQRQATYAYMAGISKHHGFTPILINGMSDHVHILATQSRTVTISNWVGQMKTRSTLWVKDQDWGSKNFGWQHGYAAYSVSVSDVDRVRQYISDQESHHRKQSFQDEYRQFMREHGIQWLEEFVWD